MSPSPVRGDTRAGDEVVGEVRTYLAGRLDVVDGEVEFLEGEAAHLRTTLAISWFAASDSGWPSDQPGPSTRTYTPRNPLASRRSAPAPRSAIE